MPARNPLADALRRLCKLELPGDSFEEPRLSYFTNFARLPATAVAATSDFDFITLGTGTEVIARATSKGGINIKTQASTPADNDNAMIIPAATGTGMYQITSATSQIRFFTRLSITTITSVTVSAGVDENQTTVYPDGTAGEGAMFVFDPGANITMSGITAAQQAANWICHYKIAGADVYINSGIAVVAATEYRLSISIGTDLKPRFYLNGASVGTGAALTTAKTVGAKVGVQTEGAAQRDINVRYVKMSAAIA